MFVGIRATNVLERAYFPSVSIIDLATRLPYRDPRSRSGLFSKVSFLFFSIVSLNENQLRPFLVPFPDSLLLLL